MTRCAARVCRKAEVQIVAVGGDLVPLVHVRSSLGLLGSDQCLPGRVGRALGAAGDDD